MFEFHDGQMVDFSHAFPKSILNILDYEDYDSECNVLLINAWIGWDGAGSYKQFSNSDIDTNTRNLINGNFDLLYMMTRLVMTRKVNVMTRQINSF